jgi:hypothetical protein
MSESQEYSTGPLLKPAEANARMSAEQARETEAYTLGVQTVIWGMQWVKAGVALRSWGTPLPEGVERLAIDPVAHGYNVWGHAKELLTHELKILETPNTETLYSIAVVDVDKTRPVVVVHPDHGDRYFRTSVWDIYGETRTISQKQDGSKPPPYLIAHINWEGKVPKGVNLIRIRSRLVVLGAHIAVYGNDDLPNVHALQKDYQIIALNDWGESNNQVAELDQSEAIHPIIRPNTKTPNELLFFEMLGETLKDIYEFLPDEEAFVRQVECIGITRRDGFDFESLDAATVAGLKKAALDAQSIIEHKGQRFAARQQGGTWMVANDLTSLDDWLFRATVGWKYVWGDLNTEVIYPLTRIDADEKLLDGHYNYTLHFPMGEHPPSRYWRISMYDLEGFFIGNPIKRYGIGNMAEKLDLNEDGSLTIYIQAESPGEDKEANWLPSPQTGFFLMMRMYQPEEKMYSGEYTLPPLTSV